MHANNMELLRNEAQRLIEMEVNLLQKMLDEPGVIATATQGEIQTFDRKSTLKHIEVLNGEQHKLVNLEMVLAVVGTMKSGKSTSINAIVGTEVLPNRNRPMTALPTLIRHAPGQIEPILKFENDEPIHKLMKALRVAILKPENEEVLSSITSDPDMTELIEIIQGPGKYERVYFGASAIFGFLKGLNDLVRLCRELDVAFPFSDYDEMHEFPVIEVEFVHLRESAQTSGRLALLDTPGPNEFDQPHLRKMLREQLSKASAVLAILDFTQLKSDADAEVRKQIQEIAAVSEGRLYALVNKFDQTDRHSDDEEEVKIFVAENLMNGHIRPENVFPVSSKWAYLANRARHELFVNKKLPDAKSHPWVADFGEEAFGRRWENKVLDSEEVKSSADELWADSLFHAPLEGVIQAAHSRAAAYAIDAAAAKLVDLAEKMGNLLTTRETALTKSAKFLQDQINALQKDIARVEGTETKARKGAEKLLGDLADGSKRVFSKVQQDTVASLDLYFREGKKVERERRVAVLEKEIRHGSEESDVRGLKGIFNFFLSSASKATRSGCSDFDPADPVIKFSDRNDATELLGKIEISVSQVVSRAENTMKDAMDSVILAFQSEFSGGVIAEAKVIINEMKGRLKGVGFEINLPPLALRHFPSASLDPTCSRMSLMKRQKPSHTIDEKRV